MRQEGTKTYYDFDADMEPLNQLTQTLDHIKGIMQSLPDRSGNKKAGGK